MKAKPANQGKAKARAKDAPDRRTPSANQPGKPAVHPKMSKALRAATAALAKTRGPGTSASGYKLRAGDIQGDPVRDGFIAPTRPPVHAGPAAPAPTPAPARPAPAVATPPAAAVRTERIGEDSAGQRVDNFLLNLLKGAPRSLIYRILRSGEVRVNGKKVKPEVRLEEDDQVRIPPVQIEDRDPGQAPAGLLAQVPGWVIFEDRLFLVLNKPAGIAAHGGSGISFGAIELVRQWRPKETFELVHRLDRDTSGVLVMAKRRSGLTALQAVMRENKIEKHYLALLAGRVQHDRQKVDVALAKNMLRGGERMVMVDEDGKDSLSIFNVVERLPGATLVDVQIKTGRTHQIRVHAQHLGHPVLGDDKYGDEAANKGAKHWGLKRMFLHAKSFAFSLPDQEYAFTAPLADELRVVVDNLQKR